MTPLWLGLVFFLNVHENDVHRFPSEAYSYAVYCGLRESAIWAAEREDDCEFRAMRQGAQTWGALHAAWACQNSSAWVRRHLFFLRCRIGWGAYERGEIPIPTVRIRP